MALTNDSAIVLAHANLTFDRTFQVLPSNPPSSASCFVRHTKHVMTYSKSEIAKSSVEHLLGSNGMQHPSTSNVQQICPAAPQGWPPCASPGLHISRSPATGITSITSPWMITGHDGHSTETVPVLHEHHLQGRRNGVL